MSQHPTASGRRPILVPVDFSSASRAALLFAANLAEPLGVPLVLAHVAHEPGRQPGFYRRHDDSGRLQPLEDVARGMLERFVLQTQVSHPGHAALRGARLRLVGGLPGSRIVELAVQENAALVVMATRHRSGLGEAIHGSVARQVTHRGPVPVTVIPPPEGGWDGPEAGRMGSAAWWERRGAAGEALPESLGLRVGRS